MSRVLTFLKRGLLLRCPVCGKGHIFRSPFKMYEYCPVCNFRFEREEGYFSSSMAINLVFSELVITAVVVPLAATPSVPLVPLLIIGAPMTVILPLLIYHHSRGLWMAMDHYLHPIDTPSEYIGELEGPNRYS
jgi:uncharacterized protein (DUF983 family)